MINIKNKSNKSNINEELIELEATLLLEYKYVNANASSTYSSSGSSSFNNLSLNETLYKMINPNTFNINSEKILESLENPNNTITCNLIQNFQLLINEIPEELKNLSYGIYPDAQVEYNAARFIYNKLLNYFPHAIYYPTKESEISYLIKWLVFYNLEFALRSGGHSYEPASLSSGYIIDVTHLDKYIIINEDRTSAKMSAGLKLGYIIEYLSDKRLITPTGTAACVGLLGLSLAGGKGNLTRLYGMVCDNILSIKMINWEGKLITANESQNSDLFWACKGAGTCNFGIVTEIELKVYEDIYCQFVKLTWTWDSELVTIIFNEYQNLLSHLPNEIGADFNMMYKNGEASFFIEFIKFGEAAFVEIDRFRNLFNPIISVDTGFYSQLTDFWVSYDKGLAPPFSKIKSNMIYEPISNDVLGKLVDSIDYFLVKNYNMNYQLNFSQLGGVVVDGNSSYFPKTAIMALSYFMQWTYPELTNILKSYLINLYSETTPLISNNVFPNLIDYDLEDYMTKYYGTNQDRLRIIKNQYDPNNVFKSFQSIR